MRLEELRKGRFKAIIESSEDVATLEDAVGITRDKKDNRVYSLEDNLINNTVLNRTFKELESRKRLTPSQVTERINKLGGKLKDYQEADVRVMVNLNSILNANPMGLGKTVEACALTSIIGAKRVLVLAPKTVKPQWRDAMNTWLEHKRSVYIIPNEMPSNQDLKQANFVVIANYEQVLRKPVAEILNAIHWDIIILDEVHRLKNVNNKTPVAVAKLDSSVFLGLTGTPITDRPADLFGVGHAINPAIFGRSYWNFVRKFCYIQSTPWGDKPMGLTRNKHAVDLLHNVLDKFMIRNPAKVLNVDVAEYDVVLEMMPKQQKLYKEIKDLVVEKLSERDITVLNGLSQLVHLQGVTSVPQKFDIDENVKFDWILDMLEDNPEQKVLIVSNFKKAIKALETVLSNKGIKSVSIHGDIKELDREKNKKTFIEDKNCRVFLGTIGAIGEGLDGLQSVCNTLIFLDKEWSPSQNKQVIGRIARMGQENPCIVYTLVCKGTIDEKVGKSNIEKLEDIRRVLDER